MWILEFNFTHEYSNQPETSRFCLREGQTLIGRRGYRHRLEEDPSYKEEEGPYELLQLQRNSKLNNRDFLQLSRSHVMLHVDPTNHEAIRVSKRTSNKVFMKRKQDGGKTKELKQYKEGKCSNKEEDKPVYELQVGDQLLPWHWKKNWIMTVKWEPVVVCCSKSLKKEQELVNKMSAKHKFQVREKWSPDVTHLIVPKFGMVLSPKILANLAYGKFCVTIDWLTDLDTAISKNWPLVDDLKTYLPKDVDKTLIRSNMQSQFFESQESVTTSGTGRTSAPSGFVNEDLLPVEKRKHMFEGYHILFLSTVGKFTMMEDVFRGAGASKMQYVKTVDASLTSLVSHSDNLILFVKSKTKVDIPKILQNVPVLDAKDLGALILHGWKEDQPFEPSRYTMGHVDDALFDDIALANEEETPHKEKKTQVLSEEKVKKEPPTSSRSSKKRKGDEIEQEQEEMLIREQEVKQTETEIPVKKKIKLEKEQEEEATAPDDQIENMPVKKKKIKVEKEPAPVIVKEQEQAKQQVEAIPSPKKKEIKKEKASTKRKAVVEDEEQQKQHDDNNYEHKKKHQKKPKLDNDEEQVCNGVITCKRDISKKEAERIARMILQVKKDRQRQAKQRKRAGEEGLVVVRGRKRFKRGPVKRASDYRPMNIKWSHYHSDKAIFEKVKTEFDEEEEENVFKEDFGKPIKLAGKRVTSATKVTKRPTRGKASFPSSSSSTVAAVSGTAVNPITLYFGGKK